MKLEYRDDPIGKALLDEAKQHIFYGLINNVDLVVQDLEAALARGYRQAEPYYARAVLYGTNKPAEQQKKAFSIFKEHTEADNAYAQYYLANCYWSGVGVEENRQMAMQWYEKAANNGDSEAQRKMAELKILYANGCLDQTLEAVNWARKSANQGNCYAQRDLNKYLVQASQFLAKKGLIKKALSFMDEAVDAKSTEAACTIGEWYLRGKYVSIDLEKAQCFFNKCLENEKQDPDVGISDYITIATFNIAEIMELKGNFDEAKIWYLRAAERGSWDAREKFEELQNIK